MTDDLWSMLDASLTKLLGFNKIPHPLDNKEMNNEHQWLADAQKAMNNAEVPKKNRAVYDPKLDRVIVDVSDDCNCGKDSCELCSYDW